MVLNLIIGQSQPFSNFALVAELQIMLSTMAASADLAGVMVGS